MTKNYPDEIMNVSLMFSEIETKHVREVYDFFGLIGDLGGISELFVLILGIFVFRYSEFSYNLKALEKLYLVNSKDPNIVDIKNTVKESGKPKFVTSKVDLPEVLANSKFA